MNKKLTKTHIAIALILGSVWGFGEVILGVGLKACASMMSGSLMTGVALFFIAAAWVSTRNHLTPILAVIVASLLKLLDAYLLSLPVMSGAIGNPIFAFILEGLAFIGIILILKNVKWEKTSSRALLGAGSALIAVAMFPLVKFATGVPACVYANTAIPLSIFFGPVAIAFSAITVPLGFLAGKRLEVYALNLGVNIKSSLVRTLLSPMTLALCTVLIVVFRMILTS